MGACPFTARENTMENQAGSLAHNLCNRPIQPREPICAHNLRFSLAHNFSICQSLRFTHNRVSRFFFWFLQFEYNPKLLTDQSFNRYHDETIYSSCATRHARRLNSRSTAGDSLRSSDTVGSSKFFRQAIPSVTMRGHDIFLECERRSELYNMVVIQGV